MTSSVPSIAIEDGETDSFILSTLDNDIYSCDGSPNFSQILGNSESPVAKRKCSVVAIPTWDHARPAKVGEAQHSSNGRDKIWWCSYCVNPTYSCASTTTARNHSRKIHSIIVVVEESKAK